MDRNRLPFVVEDVFVGMGCSGEPLVFVQNETKAGFVYDHGLSNGPVELLNALMEYWACESYRSGIETERIVRGIWDAVMTTAKKDVSTIDLLAGITPNTEEVA